MELAADYFDGLLAPPGSVFVVSLRRGRWKPKRKIGARCGDPADRPGGCVSLTYREACAAPRVLGGNDISPPNTSSAAAKGNADSSAVDQLGDSAGFPNHAQVVQQQANRQLGCQTESRPRLPHRMADTLGPARP